MSQSRPERPTHAALSQVSGPGTSALVGVERDENLLQC